jgi:hypothetical protein
VNELLVGGATCDRVLRETCDQADLRGLLLRVRQREPVLYEFLAAHMQVTADFLVSSGATEGVVQRVVQDMERMAARLMRCLELAVADVWMDVEPMAQALGVSPAGPKSKTKSTSLKSKQSGHRKQTR